MILIVTNKKDYTADFLILGLYDQGIDFIRLNTEDFPENIDVSIDISHNKIKGKFLLESKEIPFDSISSVWYRRPVPSIPSSHINNQSVKDFIITESKATLDGVWSLLPSFWVSHPDKLQRAESKLFQLYLAAQLGFNLPNTLVTTLPKSVSDFYFENHKNVIYKPIRRSHINVGDNEYIIHTSLIKDSNLEDINTVKLAPSLFQNYIPKLVELRITVIGTEVFTVSLESQKTPGAEIDWRQVPINLIEHKKFDLPQEIKNLCITLVQTMGLQFGAIDMILTPDGKYIFLEINPNGQWAWIQQICPEIRLRESLIHLLNSPKST